MSEGERLNGLLGFQALVQWRGEEVLTLADIPPQGGGVLIVGINPSPVSVAAGHYYQGTLGKRLWSRLNSMGLLESTGPPREDERWKRAGHGLTDVVKRPTASANDVSNDEMKIGGDLLRRKLATWTPRLILFPFLASAEAVLGAQPPVGVGPAHEGIPTFRLAGPYASSEKIDANAHNLSAVLGLPGVLAAGGSSSVAGRKAPAPGARAADLSASEAVSQPVTAADKAAGRIRFPRSAKPFFPDSRASVTVVVRGLRVEASYDPRKGPDRERSAVLSVGRQVLLPIADVERLRVTVRASDGLVSLD